MTDKKASVVIPAYNAARYIGAAISSARQQSLAAIEIIVVDDCSEDDTLAIAQQAAADDPRIQVLRTNINSGPSVARNLALAHATGDWIVLLDADDRFHCRRIEILVALGERVGADLVADRQVIVDANGVEADRLMAGFECFSGARQVTFAEFMRRSLGRRNVARGVSWASLQPAVSRAFLERHELAFEPANRWAEDYLLYVACFLRGAVMWVTPEPLYYYTSRRGSLSDTPRLADLWRICDADRRLLSHPVARSDPKLRRAVRRHMHAHERWFYYRRFADLAKAGRPGDAIRAMFENLASVRHIASEAMVQTPRLIAKALRSRNVASVLLHLPALSLSP